MDYHTLSRLMVVGSILVCSTQASAQAGRIWLTHQSNDPGRIVINWETAAPGDSVVHYGIASEEEHRLAKDENVTLHHVEIPLVRKDCVYQYRVETKGKVSPTASFKGYPTGELRVAVVGDWGYAKTHDLSAIVHDDVHLLITAGDNVPSLHEAGREGLKAFSALIDKQPALFRSTPFMPILGNHDKEAHPRGPKPPAEPVYDVSAAAYREFFALPDDEWKWRFEVPEFGACFLALDLEHLSDFGTTWQTCHAFDAQSEQFVWYRRMMEEVRAPFVFTLINEKQSTVKGLTKDAWHEHFRKGSALITGFGYFGERAELDGGLPYFNTCLKGDGAAYKDPQSKFFASEDNYLLLIFKQGEDKMTAQMKNLRGEVMDTRIIAKAGRAADEAEQPQPNSADRIVFWVGAKDVIALSDAELDRWKARGVGGFHCGVGHLHGCGGVHRFTGDANADLSGKDFELQRALRDSGVVRRAKERGLKMYLGFYVVDYYNTRTPFKDWFNDAGWAGVVIPRVRELAAAARLLGFDGITFDQELYPQTGGVSTATWSWGYPGNTHTEAEVRAKATERGRQLMRAIVEVFPQVEITVYHFQFPGTWEPVVQKQVNKIDRVGEGVLFTEFWDGMTSVEGYGAVRFINAIFYKGPHLGTYDNALQYEMNGFFATASRRFSNWSYASSRVFLSPFSWIDSGTGSKFEAARPPEFVAAQLAAHKKWGMGREVANFCFNGLKRFDYTPYVPALKSAATPSVVDAEPPRLEITSPPGKETFETTSDKLDLAGFAVDNLAICAVRWKKDNAAGTAQMTWQVKSGDYRTGYDWQMNWTARGIPIGAGGNTIIIEAEDIKGLIVSKRIRVSRK